MMMTVFVMMQELNEKDKFVVFPFAIVTSWLLGFCGVWFCVIAV